MNSSGRFDLWISGILAVVCLLLLNGLVREFQKEPKQRVVVTKRARTGSVTGLPPKSSPEHRARQPVEKAGGSNAVTKSRSQTRARTALHCLASKQGKRNVSTPSFETQLRTITPPQPKTIALQPLGYVEKADGRVEAIISVGDRVHVVREGESIEDNFKVVKISSSAVELVENSAPPGASSVTAKIGQEGPRASPGKSQLALSRGVSISDTPVSRQIVADSAVGGPQPAVRQELGYVERADGRVEAIIAEGEQVRLSQASKSFANEFHGPATSPANVEIGKASLPAINPPDSPALESRPLQTRSLTQEADGSPLVALQPKASIAQNPQEMPASSGESEPGPPDIVQPEPLADYTGNRLEPGEVAPVPPAEPAGAPASRGATPPPPSDEGRSQSAVRTLGYVEKAGGEKEAIVEVFDQVYVVREGELFAGKYKALLVTPSLIEIVEEPNEGSMEGLALPSRIERDSEDVRPGVSQWRGPPLRTDSPRTDPPVEVGKTEELGAGKPALSPSRPPPEHPVESCERPKEAKTSWTGLENLRLEKQRAETDTRSPPHVFNTVGFVQKVSGEAGAIVADEGGVYLVPWGKVFSANSKILNLLPGLEVSPLGIRALAPPDHVLELPLATSQIESTQIRR